MFWFFFLKKKKMIWAQNVNGPPHPAPAPGPAPEPAPEPAPGPAAGAYELIICPDQVSCFVPGLRCVIFTSTACTFRFLGGTRLTLYVTSSPSTGTYSPSMLKQRYEDEDEVRVKVGLAWNCLVVVARWVTVYNSYSFRVFLFRMWFLLMVYNSFLFKLLPNCTTGKKSQQSNFPPFFVLLYFIR